MTNAPDDIPGPIEDDEDLISLEDEIDFQELEAAREAEARRLFGPPEVRARKNRRHSNRLVRKYSEAVIRGLLAALSRLDEPLCAHWLSEIDLATTPLDQIINPYDLGGRRFEILSKVDDEFEVEMSMGRGNAGDGGTFLIEQRNGGFFVKEQLTLIRY